jgi:SNW domain-containing protein 1
LGLAKPTQSKDTLYDARLFNQNQGLDSGFKDDDSYNVYDKALFNQGSSSLYRPKRGGGDGDDDVGNEDDISRTLATDRFASAGISGRGFKGTEGGRSTQRDGPVEFEKEDKNFGMDKSNNVDSQKKRIGLDLSTTRDGKRRRD